MTAAAAARHDGPMHDAPHADSPSDQLTAAARQLIAAARSFLDVVEGALDDPDKVNAAVVGVAGMVRDAVSGLRDASSGHAEPWVRAASTDDAPGDEPDDGAAHDRDPGDGERDSGHGERVPADAGDDADLLEQWAAPQGPSRVRRVTLD